MQKRSGIGASAQATSSLRNSPAKIIDSRSKCYKQLSELSNLKQSGLLSDAEYASERDSVMSMLRKLNE